MTSYHRVKWWSWSWLCESSRSNSRLSPDNSSDAAGRMGGRKATRQSYTAAKKHTRERTLKVTVPAHTPVKRPTLSRILKDAEIDLQDFLELLLYGRGMILKLTYDKAGDAFAMSGARIDGECGEIWEVYPSAMLEVGEVSGELLCVEVLDATEILEDLLDPLKSGGEFVVRHIEGDLSVIKDALLEPDEENEGHYKECLIFKPGEEAHRDACLKQLRDALAPYFAVLRGGALYQTHAD